MSKKDYQKIHIFKLFSHLDINQSQFQLGRQQKRAHS